MMNRRGTGFGFRRGMGFGFRGSSPPWPFVGRGRGGLPRCGYFPGGAYRAPFGWSYTQAPYYTEPGFSAGAYPSYTGAPASGAAPLNREQELDSLRNQAETIKGQLEQIEARIGNLIDEQ